MTPKGVLRERVAEMTEAEASDLLDFLALQADPDELSEEDIAAVERGRAETTRGDYVTLEQLKAELQR